MNTFSKFNKTLTEQQKTVISAIRNSTLCPNKYPEPVNGIYYAKLDRLEVAPKKSTGFPCFYMTMKLTEGAEAETKAFMEKWPGTGNPKIFRTLSLYGTKDDAKCIGSAIGLASKLHEDTEILFSGDFDQLAADLEALRKKIDNSYAYLIEYSREDFNHIRILKILRSNVDEQELTQEPAQQTAMSVTVSNPGYPQQAHPQQFNRYPQQNYPQQSNGYPQQNYPQQSNKYNGYPQFDGQGFLPMDEPDAMQKPTSFPPPLKIGINLDDDEEFPFS